MIKKKSSRKKIEIDLTGPDGNAFVLLGNAQRLMRSLGYTKEQIDEVLNDMQSSDYEHLVERFDKEFGHFVTLYR